MDFRNLCYIENPWIGYPVISNSSAPWPVGVHERAQQLFFEKNQKIGIVVFRVGLQSGCCYVINQTFVVRLCKTLRLEVVEQKRSAKLTLLCFRPTSGGTTSFQAYNASTKTFDYGKKEMGRPVAKLGKQRNRFAVICSRHRMCLGGTSFLNISFSVSIHDYSYSYIPTRLIDNRLECNHGGDMDVDVVSSSSKPKINNGRLSYHIIQIFKWWLYLATTLAPASPQKKGSIRFNQDEDEATAWPSSRWFDLPTWHRLLPF
jgi:hypothetical protein